MEKTTGVDAFSERWKDTIANRGYGRLYEELAQTYDVKHAWILEQLGDRIKSHLESSNIALGSRILDAGCGTGLSTESLRRSAPDSKIVGIDISEAMLRSCAYDTTLVRGDYLQLPFSDMSFDNVVCCLSLSNGNNPTAALKEFSRVLSPGGAITIIESPRDLKAVRVFDAVDTYFSEVEVIYDKVIFCKEPNDGPQGEFDMGIVTVKLDELSAFHPFLSGSIERL